VPTATWDNLAPEKRERVLQAAMREFGEHGFSSGSLNVVARDAGVAKGSLFQYFNDKLELYATVCEVVSIAIHDELIVRMRSLPVRPPFFDLIEWLLVEWVDYFAGHPLERGVTAAANLEVDPRVREAVRTIAQRHHLVVLTPLLADAHVRGELAEDADDQVLAAYLLLLFSHLAIASWLPGLDPVLGLPEADVAQLTQVTRRLVAPLRKSFGAD
jgi:AcrR family transcriptional regulator